MSASLLFDALRAFVARDYPHVNLDAQRGEYEHAIRERIQVFTGGRRIVDTRVAPTFTLNADVLYPMIDLRGVAPSAQWLIPPVRISFEHALDRGGAPHDVNATNTLPPVSAYDVLCRSDVRETLQHLWWICGSARPAVDAPFTEFSEDDITPYRFTRDVLSALYEGLYGEDITEDLTAEAFDGPDGPARAAWQSWVSEVPDQALANALAVTYIDVLRLPLGNQWGDAETRSLIRADLSRLKSSVLRAYRCAYDEAVRVRPSWLARLPTEATLAGYLPIPTRAATGQGGLFPDADVPMFPDDVAVQDPRLMDYGVFAYGGLDARNLPSWYRAPAGKDRALRVYILDEDGVFHVYQEDPTLSVPVRGVIKKYIRTGDGGREAAIDAAVAFMQKRANVIAPAITSGERAPVVIPRIHLPTPEPIVRDERRTQKQRDEAEYRQGLLAQVTPSLRRRWHMQIAMNGFPGYHAVAPDATGYLLCKRANDTIGEYAAVAYAFQNDNTDTILVNIAVEPGADTYLMQNIRVNKGRDESTRTADGPPAVRSPVHDDIYNDVLDEPILVFPGGWLSTVSPTWGDVLLAPPNMQPGRSGEGALLKFLRNAGLQTFLSAEGVSTAYVPGSGWEPLALYKVPRIGKTDDAATTRAVAIQHTSNDGDTLDVQAVLTFKTHGGGQYVLISVLFTAVGYQIAPAKADSAFARLWARNLEDQGFGPKLVEAINHAIREKRTGTRLPLRGENTPEASEFQSAGIGGPDDPVDAEDAAADRRIHRGQYDTSPPIDATGIEMFNTAQLDQYQIDALQRVLRGAIIIGDDRLLSAWQEARNDREPDPLNHVTSVPNPGALGTRDTYLIAYKRAWEGSEWESEWRKFRGEDAPEDPEEQPPFVDMSAALAKRMGAIFDALAKLGWKQTATGAELTIGGAPKGGDLNPQGFRIVSAEKTGPYLAATTGWGEVVAKVPYYDSGAVDALAAQLNTAVRALAPQAMPREETSDVPRMGPSYETHLTQIIAQMLRAVSSDVMVDAERLFMRWQRNEQPEDLALFWRRLEEQDKGMASSADVHAPPGAAEWRRLLHTANVIHDTWIYNPGEHVIATKSLITHDDAGRVCRLPEGYALIVDRFDPAGQQAWVRRAPGAPRAECGDDTLRVTGAVHSLRRATEAERAPEEPLPNTRTRPVTSSRNVIGQPAPAERYPDEGYGSRAPTPAPFDPERAAEQARMLIAALRAQKKSR